MILFSARLTILMLKSLFNTYTCLPFLEKTMACLGSLNPVMVFVFVRVAMSITEMVLPFYYRLIAKFHLAIKKHHKGLCQQGLF